MKRIILSLIIAFVSIISFTGCSQDSINDEYNQQYNILSQLPDSISCSLNQKYIRLLVCENNNIECNICCDWCKYIEKTDTHFIFEVSENKTGEDRSCIAYFIDKKTKQSHNVIIKQPNTYFSPIKYHYDNTIVINSYDTIYNLNIIPNEYIEYQSSEDWCTVVNENNHLYLNVLDNNSINDRECNIKIIDSYINKSLTITIIQEGKKDYYLDISNYESIITWKANSYTINFKTNTDIKVYSNNDNITINTYQNYITYTVTENELYENKTINITFEYNDINGQIVKKNLTITQKGKPTSADILNQIYVKYSGDGTVSMPGYYCKVKYISITNHSEENVIIESIMVIENNSVYAFSNINKNLSIDEEAKYEAWKTYNPNNINASIKVIVNINIRGGVYSKTIYLN